MRARQPLLHHQYVGQYQPAEPRAPRERDSHPLSGSILTDLDEAATRERFDREREAQDAVESGGLQCVVLPCGSWVAGGVLAPFADWLRALAQCLQMGSWLAQLGKTDELSDNSAADHWTVSHALGGAESSESMGYPEDRRAEVAQDELLAAQQQHNSSEAAADTAVGHQPTDSAGNGTASRGSSPTHHQPGAPQSEAADQENPTSVGALFDPPTVPVAGRRGVPDEDRENQPKLTPYVHIPEEERRQLADDFLQ